MADYADGFVTDPVLLAHSRLVPSSPAAFLTALLGKPYLQQVVIAPHVFPSTRMQASDASRTKLFQRLSR